MRLVKCYIFWEKFGLVMFRIVCFDILLYLRSEDVCYYNLYLKYIFFILRVFILYIIIIFENKYDV